MKLPRSSLQVRSQCAMDWLTTLNLDKQKGYVVWPFYAFIFGAAAIYTFHDVIDDRWRSRKPGFLWFCAYLTLNAVFILACAVYFSVQVSGKAIDHREAATTIIALAVNFFTFRKIVRGLLVFHVTAVLAQRFALARPAKPLFTGQILRYDEYVGDLVEKNAACMFDDDVPGNGSRIGWLWLTCVMLWRWVRHEVWNQLRCRGSAGVGAPTGFQTSAVLEDETDLIIMITVWLWGSLSQVRARRMAAALHLHHLGVVAVCQHKPHVHAVLLCASFRPSTNCAACLWSGSIYSSLLTSTHTFITLHSIDGYVHYIYAYTYTCTYSYACAYAYTYNYTYSCAFNYTYDYADTCDYTCDYVKPCMLRHTIVVIVNSLILRK